MSRVVPLFFAIVPGLVWLWYFLSKKKSNENGSQIVTLFFLGAVATIPVLVIEYAFGSFFEGIQNEVIRNGILTVAVIAPIEEIAKMLLIREFALKNSAVRTKDAVILGATIGLGFATFENIIAFTEVSLAVLVLRGLTTTLMHGFTGAVLGYYLSLKNDKIPINGIALAVLFHVLFNVSIIFYINSLVNGLAIFALVVAMMVILRSLLKNNAERSVEAL